MKMRDSGDTQIAAPLVIVAPEPIVGLAEKCPRAVEGVGPVVTGVGGLIHTAAGSAGGFGAWRTNRSGWAAYAAASTAAR